MKCDKMFFLTGIATNDLVITCQGVNVSAADCNQDGSVSIGDVTTLIDFPLKGTW